LARAEAKAAKGKARAEAKQAKALAKAEANEQAKAKAEAGKQAAVAKDEAAKLQAFLAGSAPLAKKARVDDVIEMSQQSVAANLDAAQSVGDLVEQVKAGLASWEAQQVQQVGHGDDDDDGEGSKDLPGDVMKDVDARRCHEDETMEYIRACQDWM
jgi:vacuolar-type H+-ATPase subunit E/Vma4